MRTATHISEIKSIIKDQKKQGMKIGFVPTMGFFHEGHLSLMKQAKSQTDFVVVSIFVNPTQFGPGEDYETYPRDLQRDLMMCQEIGVDLVFAPSVEEMYPQGNSTFVNCEGDITMGLCGGKRPGHFKGVTTIVSKLFNIIEPHEAFFGQKDAQQVAVIEKMTRELNMTVQIIPCPIVREADGLAMSSRNVYLNPSERKQALCLSQALELANEKIKEGERTAEKLIEVIKNHIASFDLAVVDYIEIVSSKTLRPISKIEGDFLIALAVKFGKTRLIDNMRIYV